MDVCYLLCCTNQHIVYILAYLPELCNVIFAENHFFEKKS